VRGILILVYMVFAVASCNGGTEGAGSTGNRANSCGSETTGGGASSGGTPTLQSQCSEILSAYCSQAADPCNIIPEDQVSICVSSGVSTCCGDLCRDYARSAEAAVQTCIGDICGATCASLNLLKGGMLPPSCVGVVH
jgi:hypothetical protein